MSVRIISSSNSIPQLINELKKLKKYEIHVGIFGSDDAEYAMIASVHEFGITIQKEKGSIVIPERSFLRSTFDEKQNEWFKFVEKQMAHVLNRRIGAKTLCERLGAKMVADVQEKLTDLDTPPNAPATIAKKGSSNPLIDSGGLRQRITYKVVKH
ncbi:hypothetical protein I6G82_08365 [Lysinibacillus macroides]|uniref:Uncharacterized protein n=1 Tax=Lysinibacillus macroides TaxID=33935 RepID=A0A0N0CVF1_9BACI|nr:hypothetical protein [Lysinibacillus macroides]KOY81571.1 hypothetical protein ADM90_14320 [Lysinibacillus macroides]QPR69586.1 hypothetical protein I6G82_08365 [Lysinibacillus macroides]